VVVVDKVRLEEEVVVVAAVEDIPQDCKY